MNHDHKEENLFDMIARCAMHEVAVAISDNLVITGITKDKEPEDIKHAE